MTCSIKTIKGRKRMEDENRKKEQKTKAIKRKH